MRITDYLTERELMSEERFGLAARIRNAALGAIYRQTGKRFVPVAVSNRHVHLSRLDIETLFGAGYRLTPLRSLSQPRQFAAKESVSLVGPKGRIDGVRVLGPERKSSQVEISITDSFKLGIKPILRMSGDTANSPGGRIETSFGAVDLREGVIVAARHLHLSLAQAKYLGLTDGQVISLKSDGGRGIVFDNVVVRSGGQFDMEVHLDTDEANAAMLKDGDILEVV